MASKNGKGGQPKPLSELKTEKIPVRLNSREKASFDLAARRAGMALAVYMRIRLRVIVQRELEEAGLPVAFDVR